MYVISSNYDKSKISELTALTAPASTDILPIVDVSGGTGSNNKITYANLLSKAPDGSASAPSFSFNSDNNSRNKWWFRYFNFSTGWCRQNDNQFGWSCKNTS